MLAAVVGLYVVSADAGHPTYLLSELSQIDIDPDTQKWLFAGFFFAFAVKAPLFPVHTWLADATGKATPGTSVLLVCVLDKIGTYAMLRYCLGLFPDASQWATPFVVTLALISIVYGALIAIGQDDILRLIGLTSLSHFGFIVLGIFVFTTQGTSGSILYMVNHGVATAALFLAAGYLVHRKGTTSISAITGVEKTAPVLAGVFLVSGLAVLGFPACRSSSPRSWSSSRRSSTTGGSARSRCPPSCWPPGTSSGCTSGSSPARASRPSSRSRTSTAARSVRSRRSCWPWCCSASTRCRCWT
jgi:NADH-quinone oxidoreductase subunit M